MLEVVRGEGEKMEQEFDSKMRIQDESSNNGNCNGGIQRGKSFQFRAPQENFTVEDFELGKIYGVGSYSKVVRARKKDTGVVYALKIMDKKFITKENKTAYVKLERIVLDQLDHPGIVRLFFTFQDTFSLYMALESCEGGELFDQITRKGRLSENEARFYAAEVVDALEYIHGLGFFIKSSISNQNHNHKPKNHKMKGGAANACKSYIVAASMATVEALKDQGFARWNYPIRSLHHRLKSNLKSTFSQSSKAASSSSMASEIAKTTIQSTEMNIKKVMEIDCFGPSTVRF